MGICLHHIEMILHNQFLFILVVHSRDKDGYRGKPQSKSNQIFLDDDGQYWLARTIPSKLTWNALKKVAMEFKKKIM